MPLQTIISAKGQVVLPSSVRRRFNWEAGRKLEVIEHADGVTLRAVRLRPHLPPADVFARLAAINPATGPAISDDDMHDLVVAEATRRHDSLA